MLVQETHVNKTKNYIMAENEPYEPYFDGWPIGKIFRELQKEWGRCVSKCYVGDNQQIGWVFVKLDKYEDTQKNYLHETWVTLHETTPTKTMEYHYFNFGG